MSAMQEAEGEEGFAEFDSSVACWWTVRRRVRCGWRRRWRRRGGA